jgi:hypothetical protein
VTTISLDNGCCGSDLPALLAHMNNGYQHGHSILHLPHQTGQLARRRVKKARRLGYECREYDRSLFEDDIYAINTSLKIRQGRPMKDAYRIRQTYPPLPQYPCRRHAIHTTGVFLNELLVAYLLWYLVGEYAHVSETLGHGDHLENGVMYLLFLTAIGQAQEDGARWFGYNLHQSGTDGLRFFKERLGFRSMDVEWVL